MAAKATESGPQMIGGYAVVEKIAQGGMGAVYKGQSRLTGELVAIKVLPPHLANDRVLLKRFEQEFRAASRLDHANIVRGLEFGQEGNSPYLVLEFVDGINLGQRIKEEGRLDEAEAIRIIAEVARGLHAAHEQGLVHRDVKPDNILLAPEGGVRLTDLGLVKDMETDQDLTGSRRGLGTPNYMAPEQFGDAKHADVRCDVYYLAATLYMAVTAELPFRARGPLGSMQKKMSNELAPPRQFNPDLSERVERAIMRAMRADPDERPASCTAFVAELTGASSLRPSPSPFVPPAEADVVERTEAYVPREGTPTDANLPDEGDGGPTAHDTPHPFETQRMDRRVTVRYGSDLAGVCQPLGGEPALLWSAQVLDVSITGLGLMVSRRFEPGTILTVDLEPTLRTPPRSVCARVVRVERQSRRRWLLGCKLACPLNEEEVQNLR